MIANLFVIWAAPQAFFVINQGYQGREKMNEKLDFARILVFSHIYVDGSNNFKGFAIICESIFDNWALP